MRASCSTPLMSMSTGVSARINLKLSHQYVFRVMGAENMAGGRLTM